MRFSATELAGLADVAIAAATEAGQMIGRTRPQEVQRKAGGPSLASQMLTEVDHRSEAIILDHLRPTSERFALGLLTEERADDGGRLVAEAFWCVDPLDGTLPYVEGQPGHAVSIALVSRDGTPLIGVVHDPVEDTLVHAIRGGGAFRHGLPWAARSVADQQVLSLFADRSLLDQPDADAVVAAVDALAREMGLDGVEVRTGAGAVMNALGVLDNPPACYVKHPKPTGGGSLWDFAATACVVEEAGGVATDVRGGRLDLNRPDSTFMNHRGVLFASDEDVARRVTAIRPGQQSTS